MEQTDIVIVGAGTAGMPCALNALPELPPWNTEAFAPGAAATIHDFLTGERP